MHLFEFGENKIHYIIQRTSRRRSVGICVMPNSQVVLRVPKRLAKGEIDRILQKRADWIFKKQNYYQTFSHRFKSHQFVSGETIPYLGKEIQLEVHNSSFSKISILFQNEKLTVFVPDHLSSAEAVSSKVLQWYRVEALREIQKSIRFFAPWLKVNPKKITIRNQKHLWGSCTERHHLSFNWRLVLLPSAYLDYVVAHELSHILHLNHSEKFWRLLESVIPDSRARRRWLKEHSMEYLTFPRMRHFK